MADSINSDLPERIDTEVQLEDELTRPSAALVDTIGAIESPLLILGAGGKMGPTLALMARRAAEACGHSLEIIAVSRFRDPGTVQWLEARNVKTLSLDLLDPRSMDRLPDTANVLYLVGLKFGTASDPAATWALNTIVPSRVVERYPRARIVALSTGNVYPLSETTRGGSMENDPLTPIGEYPNAAVGRERVFEFCSRRLETPVALLRLFYAVELRYGVLVDIAQKVYSEAPIELANGFFNCVWQRDANDLILQSTSLVSSPPSVWNLCGPDIHSVRQVATRLGELLERAPHFSGAESGTALVANASKLCAALGAPPTPLDTMLRWIARWVSHGGRNLGRPTHFETRDGKY